MKGKGEKERRTDLNAEFQRKARREENNRMGKTRDFFKKIRHTNVIFHAKMDTVKDRNGIDLT